MIDQDKIREAVTTILTAIGEDPAREGLMETPRRIAELYAELFAGLDQDPAAVLKTGFDEGHHEMVVFSDLSFHSTCEHHFLPFTGTATIGYMPSGRVAGASKIARALDILARRPQMQERLTTQLADVIMRMLRPEGLGIVLSAEHLCMSLRGVRKPGAKMITSAYRGSFKTRAEARQEFHTIAGVRGQ